MKRSITLAAMLLLALFVSACSASTANIPSAVLAKGYANGQATDPGTTFAPTDTVHAVVQVANAPDDTKVKAVWTAVDAVDASGAPIKDQKVIEKEVTIKDVGSSIDFTFIPNSPFPVGKYKAEIYLDDKLDKTLNFDIK